MAGAVIRSFSEAKSKRRGFKDQTILDLLNHNLVDPLTGERSEVKTWLDQTEPGKSEIKLSSDTSTLSDFHDSLRLMIANNLDVRTLPLSPKGQDELRSSKADYIKKISDDHIAFDALLYRFAAGNGVRGLAKQGDFSGFVVKGIDISRQHGELIEGVRPNLKVQSEVAGQFVHWETMAVSRKKLDGNSIEFTHRVYLNPESNSLVQTFETVMLELEQMGVAVKGKVLDRSFELARCLRGSPISVRSDSIVLYIEAANADAVLSTVLHFYDRNSEIFEGRSAPKTPITVAPGIAVGHQPEGQGSLTAHRAGLLTKVVSIVKKELGIESYKKIPHRKIPEAIKLFKETFKNEAIKMKIDPDNFSFNLDASRPPNPGNKPGIAQTTTLVPPSGPPETHTFRPNLAKVA